MLYLRNLLPFPKGWLCQKFTKYFSQRAQRLILKFILPQPLAQAIYPDKNQDLFFYINDYKYYDFNTSK